MKRQISLLLLFGALLATAWPLAAQVEKEVEVSKSYVPKIGSATKLALQPDFTDTVKIRPDIDYTLQPRVLNTQFETRTFRPATVTYWEFNRPTPFYLKAGVGYPLNTVADLHLSTQNPSIGYVLLKLNHEGDFAKIRNYAGKRPNATRMYNRADVAAGRYIGRHIAEANLYYENYLTHRYGASDPMDDRMVGSRINFGETGLRLRMGDDFQSDKKINYNVTAYASYLYDNSQNPTPMDVNQTNGGAEGTIGFHWGSHRIRFGLGFNGIWGGGDLRTYENLNMQGSVRYTFSRPTFDAEVGLDYYYAHIATSTESNGFHYPIPYLKLKFNIERGALVPYLELGGDSDYNDFRSLLHENPYLITGLALPKNTVNYHVRFGFEGNIVNRLSYRLFVSYGWDENARYWYGVNLSESCNFLQFGVEQARRNTASVGAELKWRPATDWLIQGAVYGYIYNTRAELLAHELAGGLPALRANLKGTYTHRKFSVGASAELISTRYWSNLCLAAEPKGDATYSFSLYKVPITIDLRLVADYHLSQNFTLFVEGRNLLNERLHDWANYPLTGIACTAGIKLQF